MPLPSWVTALGTAITEGCKLALAIFAARNAPAMQANAKAKTIENLRDATNKHIAAGDLKAVNADGATQ